MKNFIEVRKGERKILIPLSAISYITEWDTGVVIKHLGKDTSDKYSTTYEEVKRQLEGYPPEELKD